MARKKTSLKERLLRKVEKVPSSIGECWEWRGKIDKGGYGHIRGASSEYLRTHRAAYAIFIGPIDDGMVIRHKCDNPGCCNPDHLVIGTQAENMKDRRSRGNDPIGERNGRSKLYRDQVEDIKWMLLVKKMPVKEIAQRYNINRSAIYKIKYGERWSHVRLPRQKKPKQMSLFQLTGSV